MRFDDRRIRYGWKSLFWTSETGFPDWLSVHADSEMSWSNFPNASHEQSKSDDS